jgi:hypothetical protein
MMHCNINGALRYHEHVICTQTRRQLIADASGLRGRQEAIGVGLRRHPAPHCAEHDDIVRFTGDIADLVAQQRLGLEPNPSNIAMAPTWSTGI